MRQFCLIAIFFLLQTGFCTAQTASKTSAGLAPSQYLFFPKTVSLKNTPEFKKDLSMRYTPAKLPFFCAMEERSRKKLKVIIKLRAGNDASYMKMISGS